MTSKKRNMKTSKSTTTKLKNNSEQVLSISLRPKSLDELIGQDSTIKAIRNHIAKRAPRTWLLTGAPGSGKTTLARIMARAYQCAHGVLWGSVCVECNKEPYDHFPIHEINASKNSGIDELEKVADLSLMRPIFGEKRVIIIDEAHFISKTAFSMLLKPTEDVPEFTVWIFATSEKTKIPVANLRRAVDYSLKGLKTDVLEKFVTEIAKNNNIDRDLKVFLEALDTAGVNSPGIVLKALEKYAAGSSAIEAVSNSGSSIDTYKLCKAITGGQWSTVRSILKDTTSDDVRMIRAMVMGWMRGGLIKFDGPNSVKNAASILELAQMPFDEAVIHAWLIATLHKITMKFAK